MKNLTILSMLAFLFIGGCAEGITGFAVSDADYTTDLDVFYVVIQKPTDKDVVATVKTSAISDFELATLQGCEAHAAGNSLKSYGIYGPGRKVVFSTVDFPELRKETSICVIVSKKEDVRNRIRLDVNLV